MGEDGHLLAVSALVTASPRLSLSSSAKEAHLEEQPSGLHAHLPRCRSKFLNGGYSPGVIRCGNCGRAFNLR